MKQLYHFIVTPKIFNFDAFFESRGLEITHFTSTRTLNSAIKKRAPDILIAEFLYGFGNNYAGINISNLDVSLYALQRYAPKAKLIVLADKSESTYIPKLAALFNIDMVIGLPTTEKIISQALHDLNF